MLSARLTKLFNTSAKINLLTKVTIRRIRAGSRIFSRGGGGGGGGVGGGFSKNFPKF